MGGTNNIDLVAGKVVTKALYRSSTGRQNHTDILANLLKALRSSLAGNDPLKFAGYTLYTVQRDVAYMHQYFGKDNKFYKDIISQKGKAAVSVPENSTFYETKVHIPEITGCLPYPDLDKVWGTYRPADTRMNEDAREDFEKQRPKRLAEGFSEIIKMSLFPSFFLYGANGGRPVDGKLCMVRFSDAMPSRGYGIFDSVIPESMWNAQGQKKK